jgi:hypothetical protein
MSGSDTPKKIDPLLAAVKELVQCIICRGNESTHIYTKKKKSAE